MVDIRNRNVILLMAVIVTFVIGFLTNDPFLWFEASYARSKPLVKNVSLEDVRRFTVVVNDSDRRVFSRTSSGWLLQQAERNYTADAKKINEALKKLLDIRRYQQITSSKEKHAEFEVADNNFHVILEGENQKELARIYLGKIGSAYNSTMVRLHGEDAVYAAQGTVRNDWNQNIDSYRDKSLLQVAKPNIKEVTVTGKNQFKLTLNEVSGWQLFHKGKETAADKNRVDSFLSQMADLKGSRFFNDKAPSLAYKVLLTLQGNLTKELEIFGPLKEGDYIARSTDNDALMHLPKYQIDNFFGKPEDFEQKASLPGQ